MNAQALSEVRATLVRGGCMVAVQRELPLYREDDETRPETRADCADVPRPCPYLSCRHNLCGEPTPHGVRFYHRRVLDGRRVPVYPEDMPPRLSCTLDVVDDALAAGEEITLERTAQLLGWTAKERTRQVEEEAILKVRRLLRVRVTR